MLGKRWFKLLVLVLGIILATTRLTDADLIDREFIYDNLLRATTLDFSNRQTANEFPQSTLFNVTGLIDGGFQVESVRVKKEGEMEFDYNIRMEKAGNWSQTCNGLELKVFRSWQQIYQGALTEFGINSSVGESGHDDLVFSLRMNGSGSATCDFNFIIETYGIDPLEQTGFHDTEVLQNHVVISG